MRAILAYLQFQTRDLCHPLLEDDPDLPRVTAEDLNGVSPYCLGATLEYRSVCQRQPLRINLYECHEDTPFLQVLHASLW